MKNRTAIPAKIVVHRRSKNVELQYPATDIASTEHFLLTCEFLRVHSQSAEVQRHGNPVLQNGKKDVTITAASLVGLYGVKFDFDDGHNTGIYTWPYLHELCTNMDSLWTTYLQTLHQQGATREKDTGVVKFFKKT